MSSSGKALTAFGVLLGLLGVAAWLGPRSGPLLGWVSVPLSVPSIGPAMGLMALGLREPWVDASGDLPFLKLPTILIAYVMPSVLLLVSGVQRMRSQVRRMKE